MTDTILPKTSERDEFCMRALRTLSRAWTDPKVNRSGLRAIFRRWTSDTPTIEMQESIWGWIGSPGKNDEVSPSPSDIRTINQAAAVTAMRAIAGDHAGEYRSLGAALFHAKLSDHRLMRLLTTPKSQRLEQLRRAYQYVDASGVGIIWDKKEVGHVWAFLFGSEPQVRRSMNAWASDYFFSRGRTTTDTDDSTENTKANTTKEKS